MTERVNHPDHYGGDDDYEVIKVLENWYAGHVPFNEGNTIKYIARAKKKDPLLELEDLKKARFYLDRAIMLLEHEKGLRPFKLPPLFWL